MRPAPLMSAQPTFMFAFGNMTSSAIDVISCPATLAKPKSKTPKVLIVAAAKVFGPVDTLLLLWPSVQKILQYPISFPPPDGLTISFLLNSVHTPLNRRRYRKALVASLGKGSAAQSLLEGILLEGDEGRATGEGGGEVSDQQQPSQVEPEIGSEDWKVFLLQDYIQHAAGEISKKAQQWRNGLMGQLQASIGTTLGSLQSRMLDTMVSS